MVEQIKIDYLRISVTDRYNLSYIHGLPKIQIKKLSIKEVLSYDEIARFVRIMTKIGIRNVRITGGEPLLRYKIEKLLKKLSNVPNLSEISMTTNGIFLDRKAETLRRYGLDRVNINLNTLKRDRYKMLTGKDNFRDVWNGISTCISLGLKPVKINAVILKDINDDEILDLAKMMFLRNVCARFMEYLGADLKFKSLEKKFIPNKEIKRMIENNFGKFERCDDIATNGPAINYRLKGAVGSVGFINSHTENFCHSCNRLRLSPDGKLYPCLFCSYYIDVRKMLCENISEKEIIESVIRLLINKHNYTRIKSGENEFSVCETGGC